MILLVGSVMTLVSACGGSGSNSSADDSDTITSTVYMGVKTI